jgi:Flp pilus assembly pilin Flp
MLQLLMALKPLSADRRAVTALEYGLLASIILAVILAGFQFLGGSLADAFNAIGAGL